MSTTDVASQNRPGRPALEPVQRELSARLLVDRYRALARLRDQSGGGEWFHARMLGRPALVVSGEQGVRTFYDPELVTRHGAVPAPIRLVLFGPGAVHGLNGAQHHRRKQLFLDVIDRQTATRLSAAVSARLEVAVAEWRRVGAVRLFDALAGVYGAAVLDWAGTGTSDEQARVISRELAAIVDGFGVGGSPYPRAALARVRAQRWALQVIRSAREGPTIPPEGTPVAMLAATPRSQLSDLVAATELLNIVRPTVAVAYFGAYAAHAIDRRPDWRTRLASGSPEHLCAFEHEIRRWYPFVPLLTGRLQGHHEWGGHTYGRGDWMVLDVLGTNRDARAWARPDEFEPERFVGREPTAFDYVPQGGGDPAQGHRCPGEPLAVGILGTTLQHLAGLDFELSATSTQVPADRIPSLPPDRMALHHVRSRATA